jgi:hypothetical protein
MGDGTTHVHPLEIGNAWIVNLLAEVLIPSTLRNFGVSNNVSSDITKSTTDAPSTYPYGVSIYRTNTDAPFDGQYYTIKSYDNILIQINSSYKSQSKESIAIRRGHNNTGVIGSLGDDTWSSWLYIRNTETPTALTLQNNWVVYDSTYSAPEYYLDGAGIVHLKGLIKSGITTQWATITTLPSLYRPLKNIFVGAACSVGYATLRISPTGEIQIISVPSNDWLSLEGVSFKAEQ